MKQIGDIADQLNQNAELERSRATDRVQSQYQNDQLVSAIKGIQLVMPEVQKMQWEVSIEGLKDMIERQKDEMQEIIDAIKNLKPEIVLPEQNNEVKIADIDKVVSLLTKMSKRPEPKEPVVNIPAFPSTIRVQDMDGVMSRLQELVDKEESPVEYEQPLGYSFHYDSENNLESIVEMYPSGNVTSRGWNLGRVKIEDERKA